MGAASYDQTSFLGGEWSQSMQGRIDRPDYKTAMNVCLNGLPIETGAWERRSGTRHEGTTRGGVPGRIISFAFQENIPYKMCFVDGYLNFLENAELVTTNDSQIVTSISTANPALVTIPLPWPLTVGYGILVYFSNLGNNTPLLLNRVFVLTPVSATTGTLTDSITFATIDGSTLGALASGAMINRVLDIQTPYIGRAWETLRSVQAETNAVFLQGNYAPQVLAATPPANPANFATFTFQAANFVDGPYLDPVPHGAFVTPSAVSGAITLSIGFPAWSATTVYGQGDFSSLSGTTYQSSVPQNLANSPASYPQYWTPVPSGIAVGPNGFQPADLGRHVRLLSEPAAWSLVATYPTGASVTYGAGTYWTALKSVSAGVVPGTDVTSWSLNQTAAIWTWGKITSLATIITPTGTNIGSMTGGGGLAAAFDGTFSKIDTLCANLTLNTDIFDGQSGGLTGYVGRHFTSPTAIQSVNVVPSTNNGMAYTSVENYVSLIGAGATINFGLNLYASNSAPSSPTNGTLLNSYSTSVTDLLVSHVLGGNEIILTTGSSALWSYMWVEVVLTVINNIPDYSFNINLEIAVSQVQFVAPGTATNSSSCTAEIFGQPLTSTNNVNTWRLGLYNGATGWPTCGTYQDGRLWLSGSIGNRVDAAQPNQDLTTAISFAPTEIDDTVTDSNAITAIFNATDVNAILWMQPDQQGIICGTEAGEWLISSGTGTGPITPLSIQAHRVTKIGCANIEPRRTEHTNVFVQKFTRRLIEYFPDVFSGKFTAPNLSLAAPHLGERIIEEIAYQQERVPTIWARCADGSLIGAAYKRDTLMTSSGPTFIGWHEHTSGSGRQVTSMCVGPSVDGTMDALSMVTFDPSTGIYHLETLNNIFMETDPSTAAWFVDDAISANVQVPYTSGGSTGALLTGLWDLNGKTCSIVLGGLDLGDWAVASGQVFVPYGADPAGLFTSAFVAGLTAPITALAGFTYTSRGQLCRPQTPQESGARLGPSIGKIRRNHKFALQLVNAQGLTVGSTFNPKVAPMHACLFTSPGGTPYAANQLFSGIYRDSLEDDNSLDGMICWQITRPYPATITAVGGFIQTQDI